MKADCLHKFNSLALSKFGKYKNKLRNICFEHYVLIIRMSKLYNTSSGVITLCRWLSGAQSSFSYSWLAMCIVVDVLCVLLLSCVYCCSFLVRIFVVVLCVLL